MLSGAIVTVVGCVAVVGVALAFSSRAQDQMTRTLRFNAALAVACTIGLAGLVVVLVAVQAFVVALFVALLAMACSYPAAKHVKELRQAASQRNV